LTPLSTSLFPTAAPIMPGAITATTGVITSSLYRTRPPYQLAFGEG
jgi:hypothetical protein